jgi:hypothetical protein
VSDLFDTRQIPDDPAYWDALAEGVAARAARDSSGSVLEWFAHSRSSWIAASLLLAAGLAFMMLPVEDASAPNLGPTVSQSVTPGDDLGKAIVSRDTPPSVGALLFLGSAGAAR